jgi:hypothetical protein
MKFGIISMAVLLAIYVDCRSQTSQANVYESFVGEWYERTNNGDTIRYIFNADSTMFMIDASGNRLGNDRFLLPDGREAVRIIRYLLDDTEEPSKIDLVFCADNRQNEVSRAKGIFEILDDGLIRVALNYEKPLFLRPVDFANTFQAALLAKFNVKRTKQDCLKFRNGKFSISDPFIGSTFIERDGDTQLEFNENRSHGVRLKVEWIDDCTYGLQPIEFLKGSTWSPDTTGVRMTVRIIKTLDNSYIQNSEIEAIRFNLTKEVFRID